MPDPHVVLVTGATGNTGAHVVSGLRQAGHRVLAASRHPSVADDDAVPFDWSDADTFGPALAGVRAVYLVAPAGVADPVPLVRPFLELGVSQGVARVVQLSSSAVERGEPGLGEVHDLIASAVSQHTILRPSWFMQNFVGNHPLAERIRLSREVASAAGLTRLGFIDAEDIAAVAVQALVADDPLAPELTLTGPESLSYSTAAGILSEVLGTPVRHVDLARDQFATHLADAGYPADFAATLADLDEQIRSGGDDVVTDTVREVTGREPRSLREFLTDNAELLRA